MRFYDTTEQAAARAYEVSNNPRVAEMADGSFAAISDTHMDGDAVLFGPNDSCWRSECNLGVDTIWSV